MRYPCCKWGLALPHHRLPQGGGHTCVQCGFARMHKARTRLHSNSNCLHRSARAGFRDGRSVDGQVTAWDGTRWTTIREAQEGVSTLQLVGLAANQLWVARGDGVLHFNGQGWTSWVSANMPAGGAEPVCAAACCCAALHASP